MRKTIILTVFCIVMIFSLVGCKSKNMQSFVYDAKDITGIEIETGGASVSVLKNSGSDIEISYIQEVAEIQDKLMKINIPMTKAGINIQKQSELIISVPDVVFDTIQIKSEVGNINVSEVDTVNLRVEAQHGNITIVGLDGNIDAEAEMGSIKTDLPIGNKIENLNTVGQKLDGQIGTSGSAVKLYTNTGIIELK